MNNNPIGVFDSGLGGLTVVKAIQDILPNESIIYLGDTARVPYGDKSPETIRKYSRQITDFLINNGAKIIVIACNTASALAMDDLKKYVDIPVIDVITPGVEAGLQTTKNKKIGILGTTATISSMAYDKKLKDADPELTVISQACPLFVPLVEEGWVDGVVAEHIAEIYLQQIKSTNIDTLILGCTHYPLLKPLLKAQLENNIKIIDSAVPVAENIFDLIRSAKIQSKNEKKGTLLCFTTDTLSKFRPLSKKFLGKNISKVSSITF